MWKAEAIKSWQKWQQNSLGWVGRFAWVLLAGFAANAAEPAPVPPVLNETLVPRWAEDGASFWYRAQRASNRFEYVRVRLPSGEKSVFEPSAQERQMLQPLAGVRSSNRASRETGEETSIRFLNQNPGAVRLFWLDSEGSRRPYGSLAPGEARDQHTFAGHVWLALDAQDRELVVVKATELPSEAEIPAEPRPGMSASATNDPAEPRPRNRSPDGRYRAVFSAQNLVLEGDSSQRISLTTNGTSNEPYEGPAWWSPDSRKLIIFRTRPVPPRKIFLVESSPRDQLQPRLHEVEYPKPGDDLSTRRPCLFQVESGREIPVSDHLFTNAWSLSHFHWRTDSREFLFLYNQRGHQTLRLIGIDAETGSTRVVIEETSPTFIDYAGKLFLEILDDTAEVVWMSERDGWNHLYLYDRNTGAVKHQVTRGEWVVRGVEHVDRALRQIYFRAAGMRPGEDPYQVHFGRVNFDGTGLVWLTDGDRSHTVRFSPDRQWLVATGSRPDAPPVHELRNARSGERVVELERADASAWSAARWRVPTPFHAKGRDGETGIHGLIHWPRNYDANQKYPVIESIYAGPHGAFVPKTFHRTYSERAVADEGYIVVKIDGMGTSHRSKAFHNVAWKNLGDSGFPDRIAWMRAAAARYPSLDLSRVGIYGTSAGGQSALRAVIAHADFYRAAVADCGCHDNRMDKIWWNELWMGWPLGPHYAEQSNVTQAHRLGGKLLLLVGELDRNVDPASTLQVVDALVKADKQFEFLLVPGQGHGVLGLPHVQKRMLEFFRRSLGPASPVPEPL